MKLYWNYLGEGRCKSEKKPSVVGGGGGGEGGGYGYFLELHIKLLYLIFYLKP